MWIQLNDQQVEILRSHLENALPLTEAECTDLSGRLNHYAKPELNDQRFRNAVHTNDELECDEDAVTAVSGLGAFVHTWTWVDNYEVGIEDEV
jgi:hypothetical protein